MYKILVLILLAMCLQGCLETGYSQPVYIISEEEIEQEARALDEELR